MGNEIVTESTGFSALSEQQQLAHRAKIGARCRAILGQFWQSTDVTDLEKTIEVEGWMDVLENCSHSEIRFAWRDYQTKKENRSERGRLVRPDAGALLQIIYNKRPRPQVVHSQPKPEPEKQAPTAEERERMAKYLADAGFKPKKFGVDQ